MIPNNTNQMIDGGGLGKLAGIIHGCWDLLMYLRNGQCKDTLSGL